MNHVMLIAVLLLTGMSVDGQEQIYKRDMKIMGCAFEVTVVADDQTQANVYIDLAVGEMRRIERLISSWDPSSQTSQINRMAGVQPVKVDLELLQLIERSLQISKLTDGAFDISYASMDFIWKFDGSMGTMPSENSIAQSVARVGYENILVDRDAQTVFLKHVGMKIGFGAIGKGYAAERAKQLLVKQGVSAGIINASGDMTCWGAQPDGSDWKVAITNPMDKTKSFGLLAVKDGAVVTSGNYEKYVIIDGQRYAHIIDPRTGYPSSGILSATVFAPSAELADALATSIFVMGIDVGVDRINQIPGVSCIIIDDQGHIHRSEHLQIEKL